MSGEAERLVLYYLDRLKLRPFLDDPATEDIAVQEPGVAWVRQGSWTKHEIPEADLETLEELAFVSGSIRHQEHGEHAPILDTELPDGERLNVVAFPHVPPRTISITIRRHEDRVAPVRDIPKRYITDGWNKWVERSGPDLSELLAFYDADDIVGFIQACVKARQNIVLAGATGSSKTTMLKTICSAIDHSKRVITIEDAKEATILQPNHVRLLFDRDDLEAPTKLLQSAMRMHPDIVILGEMRGREAWTYVHDVVPPHPGSVISVHAHSPSSAFMRIMGLCKSAPAAASYDDRALALIVASAVDVIIPLEQISREFHVHPVWFVGEAQRRGQKALELLP